MVHLGGIADVGYCRLMEDSRLQGKLVETTDPYLNEAIGFVDNLVAAIVYKTCGKAITPEQRATVSAIFR